MDANGKLSTGCPAHLLSENRYRRRCCAFVTRKQVSDLGLPERLIQAGTHLLCCLVDALPDARQACGVPCRGSLEALQERCRVRVQRRNGGRNVDPVGKEPAGLSAWAGYK